MSAIACLTRVALLFFLVLHPAAQAWTADYHNKDYLAAVEDAKVRTAQEISRELWALTPANPHLVWEGKPGASRVKMTFWAGAWVQAYEGGELRPRGDMETGDALFMVPSGQMELWFMQRSLQPTPLRLEQLLGLPPETGKSHFAEVWVDLSTLLRPSPDPETSDHEAELDFPSNDHLTVSQTYRDWFTARLANTYSEPAPYPFTGFGYTYDWGSGDHVGLSEFIVLPGRPVEVIKVYSNREFFEGMTPR